MRLALILSAVLTWMPVAAADAEPAQVLVLGTYHFANPGLDQHNVQSVDVLEEPAQTQIAAIVDALARFEPTQVFVEWPADITDERYRQYLDGSLPPSRNEVVQLGFAVARRLELPRVHGIDVSGTFPFGPIVEWAQANGRAEALQAGQAAIAAEVAQIERAQNEQGIAAALRLMNEDESLRRGHGMYMELLRYGNGETQPGVELNVAWFERNLRTCALLLQQVEADGRALVIFGAGHVPWLQRCVTDTPGVELVRADDYLPTGTPMAKR